MTTQSKETKNANKGYESNNKVNNQQRILETEKNSIVLSATRTIMRLAPKNVANRTTRTHLHTSAFDVAPKA